MPSVFLGGYREITAGRSGRRVPVNITKIGSEAPLSWCRPRCGYEQGQWEGPRCRRIVRSFSRSNHAQCQGIAGAQVSRGGAMTELRPYQVEVIAAFDRTVAAGVKRVIQVAPTGSGKTLIAGTIIKAAVAAWRTVLVLSHRREITAQTSRKLYDLGISHGIIQAGFSPRPLERVQVASVQTLSQRAIRTGTMPLPRADVLVIDECHHCPAETYQQIIAAYPEATLLGLTATPCRGDGRGLGGIFQIIIECPQVAELIEQGYLVVLRHKIRRTFLLYLLAQ
jgi:superfamily II DNA or RNA helicase